MERRPVAFEIANLMSFEYGSQLYRFHIGRIAKVIDDHAAPTYDRIIKADRELFSILADLIRDGLEVGPDRARPFDKIFEKALAHEDFRCCLNNSPLPFFGGCGNDDNHGNGDRERKSQRQTRDEKKSKAFLDDNINNPLGLKRNKGSPRYGGKAGDGGKGQKRKYGDGPGREQHDIAMPQEFRAAGGYPIIGSKHNNAKVYYDYDMKKDCNGGFGCSKGLHVCGFRIGLHACGGPHPVAKCQSNAPQ